MLKEYELLEKYINEIEYFDATNREGHAAKVYFNAIFGIEFSRKQDNDINSGLNYGYAIVLSAINREISSMGYLNQIGIFHDNQFNYFNLGCDIMEPIRSIIDYKVIEMSYDEFTKNERAKIISILKDEVLIDNTKQTLLNALGIYTRSVIESIHEGDISKIKYINFNKYINVGR